MKSLALLFLLFSLKLHALTITSLNIEWYGRGGVISGSEDNEYRDPELQRFLSQALPPSDIYVFQEITAPERLKNLFHELDCYTYESELSKHQYVLICASRGLVKSFTTEFAVQVGNPRLRAAPIVEIELESGKLLSLAGVHLKAGPKDIQTRLDQIKALATSQLMQGASLVIGDFNSFESDEIEMNRVFKESSFNGLVPPTPTYYGRTPHIFDRAWARDVQVKSIEAYGPCEKEKTPYPFNQFDYYERFISDHCAIQVTL